MTDDESIRPFVLAVEEDRLDDLRGRLRRARLPDTEPVNSTASGPRSWSQGVPRTDLDELRRYWLEAYSWRRAEQELNEVGQHVTDVDGVSIHFLHLRSSRADAQPLLMTHGWPGSVVEFLDVVRELAEPDDPGSPAFSVVAPSLPGFAFSGSPRVPGWGAERIADAWAVLMERLGHDRFLAQGGDWGGVVTTELAVRHPDRVTALHTTFPQAEAPPGWTEDALSEQEAAWLRATRAFWAEGSAYARQQAAAPQTLGYALVDSPVGLLAWIYDKVHAWSDPENPSGGGVSRDRLLDNVMLHWLGGSGASAARIYWESWGRADKGRPVTVSTAVSVFPHEIEKLPRAWVAARYSRLERWSVLDHGGHFPSLEVPQAFLREVRAAFADHRPTGGFPDAVRAPTGAA